MDGIFILHSLITNKIKNAVTLFIASLATLTLLRVLLYFFYFNKFESLTFYETVASFFMGARVDIAVIGIFLGWLLLIYFLPFRFTYDKKFQKYIYIVWYILLSVIVLIQLSGIVYFEYVSRHMASEITAMQNDMHVVLDMAIQNYHEVFIFFIFEILLFFALKRALTFKNEIIHLSLKRDSLTLLIVALLIFLGIRSNISGKPLGLSDAFVSNNSQSGNLAISTPFSIVKTISQKHKNYTFYSQEKALENSINALKSSEFTFKNKNFALLRESTNKIKKNHNVVIIMLESWSAKYIDSFSGTNFEVTKNFDALAKEGLMFTNFFANGQRSIDGITALLTGICVMPGFEYLGHGLELSDISYLPEIAKKNGYTSLAMQSSKRESFRIDSIAKLSGFDNYFGAEDMEKLGLEQSGADPRFGTWDNNMLNFYHKKINELREPFLSFAFTSSTHVPFVSPGKRWEKYPHNENNIYGFLNTLNYSDEVLGDFMKKAKQEPWFDNTIFIFLADHTLGFGDDTNMTQGLNLNIQNRELENLRIPLLVYAPKIFPKPQVITKLSSQADILPTLTHFLGWSGEIATISNSIFSTSNSEFVLFSYGNILGYKNNNGFLKHTLEKELESNISTNDREKVLSLYQTFSYLYKNNKLSR